MVTPHDARLRPAESRKVAATTSLPALCPPRWSRWAHRATPRFTAWPFERGGIQHPRDLNRLQNTAPEKQCSVVTSEQMPGDCNLFSHSSYTQRGTRLFLNTAPFIWQNLTVTRAKLGTNLNSPRDGICFPVHIFSGYTQDYFLFK